jgi:spore coat polysaccharide biosynthesis protein SpsF
MKRVVGIIQARLGSTRLPLKMLLSLHGKPIIEWVVDRVKKSYLLDVVVVAIPESEDNNILEKILVDMNVEVFRGSEDDVLERFYLAAKEYKADYIVRICADNPLIDPTEIDNLINFYFSKKNDYAYNHFPRNNKYPDGLGAEMVSYSILEKLNFMAKEKNHREHCLSFITDHPDSFSIGTFDPLDKTIVNPNLKFDIDNFQDYLNLAMKDFDISTSASELVKIFSKDGNEIRKFI